MLFGLIEIFEYISTDRILKIRYGISVAITQFFIYLNRHPSGSLKFPFSSWYHPTSTFPPNRLRHPSGLRIFNFGHDNLFENVALERIRKLLLFLFEICLSLDRIGIVTFHIFVSLLELCDSGDSTTGSRLNRAYWYPVTSNLKKLLY